MGEEIAFENGRISDFQELMTLTLDRVILHTVMHPSSPSTYIRNVIEIEECFCERADGHLRPTLLGRLGGVHLKIKQYGTGYWALAILHFVNDLMCAINHIIIIIIIIRHILHLHYATSKKA